MEEIVSTQTKRFNMTRIEMIDDNSFSVKTAISILKKYENLEGENISSCDPNDYF